MKQAIHEEEWSIRKATEADSEAIVDLLKRCGRLKESDFVVSEYFIAESFGKVIGCVAARKRARSGYLYRLVVEKSHRRHGIGHALTQFGLDWLSGQGVASVFALVMFWNIRFVKRHGFELATSSVKSDLQSLHSDFVDRSMARSALVVSHNSRVQRL